MKTLKTKNLMNDEVLKQLLRKISSLESRIGFLEARNAMREPNQADPSYWQTGHMGYQPVVSSMNCTQPQAHPERCDCPHPPKGR